MKTFSICLLGAVAQAIKLQDTTDAPPMTAGTSDMPPTQMPSGTAAGDMPPPMPSGTAAGDVPPPMPTDTTTGDMPPPMPTDTTTGAMPTDASGVPMPTGMDVPPPPMEWSCEGYSADMLFDAADDDYDNQLSEDEFWAVMDSVWVTRDGPLGESLDEE